VLAYAARRVPSALLVLLLASGVIFLALRLIPGDPAITLAGANADPEIVAAIREDLGLDEPLAGQYVRWLSGFITGDLGNSYILGAPIGTLIGRAAGRTVELAVAAMLLALTIAFSLGIVGALHPRGLGEAVVTAYSILGFAVPSFIVGVLLILLFAITFRVLPPGGHVSVLSDPLGGLRTLVLPAFTLSLPLSAVLSRFLMTALRHVMEEDYMRTAISKGLPARVAVIRHALPNALPPVLTVIGLEIGGLLGGTALIEALFAWPGLGLLMLNGLARRDYLLVQDLVLIGITVYLAIQLLTDLAYAALDPRVRLGATG